MGAWLWRWARLGHCLSWCTCDCRTHLKYLFLILTTEVILPSLKGNSEDKPVKPWKTYRPRVTGEGYGFVTPTCRWGRTWGLGRARACPQARTSPGRVQSDWYRTVQLRKGSCLLGLCHAEIPGPVCPAFLLGSLGAGLPLGRSTGLLCRLPGPRETCCAGRWRNGQSFSKNSPQRSQMTNLHLAEKGARTK